MFEGVRAQISNHVRVRKMKRPSMLFVAFFMLTLFYATTYAEYMGHKHYGVVVFDRWDGCILYRGIYVTYVSESVKEQLRKHTGQAVLVNATKVHQPMNPGDGVIKEFEHVGPPPVEKEEFSVAGLELRCVHGFKDGQVPVVIMEIINSGTEERKILPEELAPTLLTKQPQPPSPLSPSDGPSVALVTRLSIRSIARHNYKARGVSQGIPYSLSVKDDPSLRRESSLKPGEKKQIRISFDLPEGEYQFLHGYGGGHYGRKFLASNSISFDVDKDGKGRVVKSIDTAEVVNGLQLLLESEFREDGQPKLVIHWRNVGSEPLDLVEMSPIFLEVQESPRCWRAFQHPDWDSRKIDTKFTFEPGHSESETEPVSEFTTLAPGRYLVRVSMAFDRGMGQKYKSDRLWTGMVKSNTIGITVPDKDENLGR